MTVDRRKVLYAVDGVWQALPDDELAALSAFRFLKMQPELLNEEEENEAWEEFQDRRRRVLFR